MKRSSASNFVTVTGVRKLSFYRPGYATMDKDGKRFEPVRYTDDANNEFDLWLPAEKVNSVKEHPLIARNGKKIIPGVNYESQVVFPSQKEDNAPYFGLEIHLSHVPQRELEDVFCSCPVNGKLGHITDMGQFLHTYYLAELSTVMSHPNSLRSEETLRCYATFSSVLTTFGSFRVETGNLHEKLEKRVGYPAPLFDVKSASLIPHT